MSRNVKSVNKLDYDYSDRCSPDSFSKKLMVYLTEFKLEYLKDNAVRRKRFKDCSDRVIKRELVYASSPDVAKSKLESIYSEIGRIVEIRFIKAKHVRDHVKSTIAY